MAYDYVDAHRLIRYRSGQARDITAFAGDLQAVDELNALSVELSFGVIVAPWDHRALGTAVFLQFLLAWQNWFSS